MELRAKTWIVAVSTVALWGPLEAGAETGDRSVETVEVTANCEHFEEPIEGPDRSESVDWSDWWLQQVGVDEAEPLDAGSPGETTWLVLSECERDWYAHGFEVDDRGVRPVMEERVHTQDCCGARGMIPESLRRLTVDGRAYPGFEIRGRWNGGGEQSFYTSGAVSMLLFPTRVVERTGESDGWDGEVVVERADRLVGYSFGASGPDHYQPDADPGEAVVSVTRNGDYMQSRMQRILDPETREPIPDGVVQGYYCRRIRAEMKAGDEDDELIVEQTVEAPVGEEPTCREGIREDPDGLWEKTSRVGTIERRLRIGEEAVEVEMDAELDETVDLEGEVVEQ